MHPFDPGVTAQLTHQVLDCLLDLSPRRRHIDADKLVRAFDDASVAKHRVHAAALRLIDDVPVRVEHREHHWRRVVLDEDYIRLLADLETTDQPVHPQRLAATSGGPGDDAL